MALIQYCNEYKTLKSVMLYRPSFKEIQQDDYRKAMFLSSPNPERVMKEFEEIVNKLTSLDINVVILDGSHDDEITPNMIYLRDVAFVFRDKIIIGNMKHDVRKNEPEKFLRLLTNQHPELAKKCISYTKHTMEGADILAISKNEILVYTGSRTDAQSIKDIVKKLSIQKVSNLNAKINGVPQHLLGGIHIVGRDSLIRRDAYCPDTQFGFENIKMLETTEVAKKFSTNIITLKHKEILMPSNCPLTQRKLEKHGIKCHTVDISEIHKMGGGLACMTLPLHRSE